MTAYFQFLNLSVEHGFFRDERCRHLNLVPSRNTQQLLDNADLAIRQSGNGVSLFASVAGLEVLRLHASEGTEPLRLVFKAYSPDPFFGNYTESAGAGLFHFETSALANGDEPLHLHQADHASEADRMSMEAAAGADLLEASERLVKPVFIVVFNLSSGHLAHREGEPFRPHRYLIRFKARETVWKYLLLGDLCREGLSMKGQNGQPDFVFLGQERLANDQPACVFRSTVAIPLRERSDMHIQLLGGDARGSSKVLVKRLPVPSCTQLGLVRIDEAEVLVSEIYVNS
jgi:hypothetical protein